MKKKVILILTVLVVALFALGTVFAWELTPNNTVTMPGDSQPFIEKILGALQNAGMIVGTFILVFFGFKYLTAGATEKAKTKEMMAPFLIGAAVIILAPAIANWIWEFAKTTP